MAPYAITTFVALIITWSNWEWSLFKHNLHRQQAMDYVHEITSQWKVILWMCRGCVEIYLVSMSTFIWQNLGNFLSAGSIENIWDWTLNLQPAAPFSTRGGGKFELFKSDTPRGFFDAQDIFKTFPYIKVKVTSKDQKLMIKLKFHSTHQLSSVLLKPIRKYHEFQL